MTDGRKNLSRQPKALDTVINSNGKGILIRTDPQLGSQPADDISHKSSNRQPLFSARPIVDVPVTGLHCP